MDDYRQRLAEQMVSIFRTQLLVNAISLVIMTMVLILVVVKLFRDLKFQRHAREYYDITKMYVDLVYVERGRLRQTVEETAHQTKQAVEVKIDEIKKEIKQQGNGSQPSQETPPCP